MLGNYPQSLFQVEVSTEKSPQGNKSINCRLMRDDSLQGRVNGSRDIHRDCAIYLPSTSSPPHRALLWSHLAAICMWARHDVSCLQVNVPWSEEKRDRNDGQWSIAAAMSLQSTCTGMKRSGCSSTMTRGHVVNFTVQQMSNTLLHTFNCMH
jgi:hypothetical protein